jgi:uncharacterized protein
MLLFLILIITEVLTPLVLKQHIFNRSKALYYLTLSVNVILSLWVWALFFELAANDSFFDNPQHVWLMMNMNGVLAGIIAPKVILIIFHFSGVFLRRKTGDYIQWVTNIGLSFAILLFLMITTGTLYGRFNIKTEELTIKIKGLNKALEGLKIVQISDLHLAGFYHHNKVLGMAMNEINAIKPDLILNTGDFVSFGWREFGRNDTILSKAKSTYGNFAVMGNHDFGTYQPDFTEADRANNVLIMNNLIKSSGYSVLNDENTIVKVGNAKIGIIGIITIGRHPNITHGNMGVAISGLDSVDLKILLSHDPNQWEKDVTGKTDINLTLSGHTHGMQMGILTKKFKWSPSKYFYPHWNGLYKEGEQYQYVNRGLGVLAIPFRIWMPPEITVITLKAE